MCDFTIKVKRTGATSGLLFEAVSIDTAVIYKYNHEYYYLFFLKIIR